MKTKNFKLLIKFYFISCLNRKLFTRNCNSLILDIMSVITQSKMINYNSECISMILLKIPYGLFNLMEFIILFTRYCKINLLKYSSTAICTSLLGCFSKLWAHGSSFKSLNWAFNVEITSISGRLCL